MSLRTALNITIAMIVLSMLNAAWGFYLNTVWSAILSLLAAALNGGLLVWQSKALAMRAEIERKVREDAEQWRRFIERVKEGEF